MDLLQFESIIKPLYSKELNYDLSKSQIEKFFDFMNYLIEENKKINLTTIIDPIQIIYKHFLDSCELIKFFNYNDPKKSFIDIGCGAGFPSIPLSILFTDSTFLLVDSVDKKLKFINRVVERINLCNAKTIHSRIEDLGHKNTYIENFDYCVSRALSKIPVVLEYSSSFLKIGGSVFIYKMQDSQEELLSSKRAQTVLSFIKDKETEYILFDTEPSRIIYSFLKKDKTPKKYPRKVGTPSKSPL